MNTELKCVFVVLLLGCEAEGVDNSVVKVENCPEALLLPHLAGSDGMRGCLVLGYRDVGHAI